MKKLNLLIYIILILNLNLFAENFSVYLIKPKEIKSIYKSSLYCFNRNWYFSRNLNAKVKNDMLYFHFNGSKDDSIFFFTVPGENYEKPLYINRKKDIFIELGKKIKQDIFLNVRLIVNNYLIKKNITIPMKGKSIVNIPLPVNSKTINNINIYFTGDKEVIVIKSIYLK